MTIFPGGARRLLIFLLSVSFFFLQGCARPVLQTSPVSDREARLTASAFTRYQEIYRSECIGSLDAEVDATIYLTGWISNHKEKLSGYLQALEPGYIKFAALNPFGQPVLIFSTNGEKFKLLNVLDGKAYSGSVNSEAFWKFAPRGFDPKLSYYWLTGRLPPGVIDIKRVLRDREKRGYWLQIKSDHADIDRMVLFDPEELTVRRHVLMSDRGDLIMDIVYEDYQPEYANGSAVGPNGTQLTDSTAAGETACMIPAKISISSNSGIEKKIELSFYSYISAAMLSPNDFELEIPDNLELRPVN